MKFKQISLYIYAFILTGRVLNINLPMSLYYGAIFLSLILFFFNSKTIRLHDKNILIFIIFLFISIILNDISSFFRPYERYLSFLINIFIFSPLFVSRRLSVFRQELFQAICNLFITYTIVSLIGLVVGIFPLQGFGGFQGITVHAMSLSVIAVISLLVSLTYYLETKRRAFLLVVGISFIVLILGASRAALLGSIVGILALIMKYNSFKFSFIKPLVVIALFLVSLVTLLPSEFLGKLTHKFDNAQEVGSALSSRENLWEARYYEFKESPVYGIGFGNMLEKYNSYGINDETGGIETGSSWGMVLSMSGLLGIVCFATLCFKRNREMLNNLNSEWNSLIYGTFAFLLVHMIFEGYIFASGSIFMILFWLTISMTYFNFKET